MPRILLLSAYDAQSHRVWREQLVAQFPQYDWTELVLPPRYFSWRIRGNSLTWAFDDAVKSKCFDLVIATSMTDISALIGMAPNLSGVPVIQYFHENQFAYPLSDKAAPQMVEPQMVQLYGAISASVVCFNSEFNRQSFLSGVRALLKKLPDAIPPGIEDQLRRKSRVLPVPIASAGTQTMSESESEALTELISDKALSIVWNHRWEYDKGPERLLACIEALPETLDLNFHILGQRFRSQPKVFEDIQALLRSRAWLGHWGYVAATDEYLSILAQTDLVLSTAVHDFQGLSVLEACRLGCTPVVPDRLAYVEIFDAEYRYGSESDLSLEASAAANMIEKIAKSPERRIPNLNQFSWQQLQAPYGELIESLLNTESS